MIAFPKTWNDLTAARTHLDHASAQIAPAVHEQLDLELISSWAARVGPHDRWWIVVPNDRPEGLTTRAEVYRAYATYAFLPATPASSLADATVVLRPKALP